jgi:hypothetical protein
MVVLSLDQPQRKSWHRKTSHPRVWICLCISPEYYRYSIVNLCSNDEEASNADEPKTK